MFRELNERGSDGISVKLFWNDDFGPECARYGIPEPEFRIDVQDSKGTDFSISADSWTEAREAYFHPFAVGSRLLKSGR